MASPSTAVVVSRFNPAKWALIIAFNVALLLYTSYEVFLVLRNSENPPIVHSVIDGSKVVNGQAQFGRMPYVLISSQDEKEVHMSVLSLKDAVAKHNTFVKVDPHEDPYNVTMYPRGFLLVNLTNLVPNFSVTERQHGALVKTPPQFEILFKAATRYLNIYTAGPNAPASVLAPPWKESADFLQWHGVLMGGTLTWLSLGKAIVPKKTVYWGWLGESTPTHEVITVTTEEAWHRTDFGVHFVIRSSSISVRVPMSLIDQMLEILGRVGGYVAGFNTFFFFVFVKRRPLTPEEKAAEELTLLGTQDPQDRA